METIRQTLFSNWHLMRWLWLVFGIVFMVQAIQMRDGLVGAIAGFFLVTAITNIGCCGARGCAVTTKKGTQKSIEETSYEEIKTNKMTKTFSEIIN